jgi:hypothetical protein
MGEGPSATPERGIPPWVWGLGPALEKPILTDSARDFRKSRRGPANSRSPSVALGRRLPKGPGAPLPQEVPIQPGTRGPPVVRGGCWGCRVSGGARGGLWPFRDAGGLLRAWGRTVRPQALGRLTGASPRTGGPWPFPTGMAPSQGALLPLPWADPLARGAPVPSRKALPSGRPAQGGRFPRRPGMAPSA